MVNKIVEVLTKGVVALTNVLGPVLNTLLKNSGPTQTVSGIVRVMKMKTTPTV